MHIDAFKLRLPPLSQVQLLDSRYSELLAFMANEMKSSDTETSNPTNFDELYHGFFMIFHIIFEAVENHDNSTLTGCPA